MARNDSTGRRDTRAARSTPNPARRALLRLVAFLAPAATLSAAAVPLNSPVELPAPGPDDGVVERAPFDWFPTVGARCRMRGSPDEVYVIASEPCDSHGQHDPGGRFVFIDSPAVRAMLAKYGTRGGAIAHWPSLIPV